MSVAGIEKKRGISNPNDKSLLHISEGEIIKIKIPDANEASSVYRKRAQDSRAKEIWHSAIREISYVIDLAVDVKADDFALRSCCNYHLGRYMDGAIDGSLGLEEDFECLEALTWRARCRKQLGEHEELVDDANDLILHPTTELLGLELRAEAALLAGRYVDALNDAMSLSARSPSNGRARQIFSEAHKEVYGYDWRNGDEP